MRTLLRVGIAGVVCAALGVAQFAVAATPAPAPATPGQGLEISPPVIELSANPGQTVTTAIRLRNVTQGELITKAEIDDFGANGESGTPQLLLNESGSNRYSLKEWVDPLPNLILAPQQLQSITVTIHVPPNAEPGGHYGVARFTGVPPNLEGTGVSLSASVGSLILMRVNGDVVDDMSLAEFASMKGEQKTSFFETGPVNFLVRLKNNGTIHEAPVGTITITNAFGKSTGVLKVDPNGGNVLPDSIRRFEQSLSQKKLFGLYHAKLALTYAGTKQISSTIAFWVIPWKMILLVLLSLVLLFFAIRWALRRYNEHIIRQSRRK